MAEAGRFTFPSEGQRSPAENVAQAGGGSRSPAENVAIGARPRSGGGSGGGRNRRLEAERKAREKAREKARKEAEEKALIEKMRLAGIAKQKADAEKAKKLDAKARAEYKRILDIRARIMFKNDREIIRNTKDARTGDILKISEWQDGANKVRRVENLTKGTVDYSSYGVGRAGGGVRKTGGVKMGATPTRKAPDVIIKKSEDPTKVIVKLPSGRIIKISNTGAVNVGARLAGRDLRFFNGQLVSEITEDKPATQGFELTSAEQTEINKLLPSNISLVKDNTGLVIGTLDSRTGRKESIAAIDKYIEQESARVLKSKGRIVESSTQLLRKWADDLAKAKQEITSANSRRDIQTLRDLQNLGNKATESQKKERDRLEKRVAENYKLGADLVGKTIGVSLINMGLGGRELLLALKNNPKATLAALPAQAYNGVKDDFNRVMAGDPLEILQVGVEYYTMAKVFGALGKAGKAGFRTSVSIGRTLSPTYFSKIGSKLVIPPATLRGTIGRTAFGSRVKAIVKVKLKKTGVTAKVNRFALRARKYKAIANRRLQKIQRSYIRPAKVKIKAKVKLAKTLKEAEIREFKSAIDYKKELASARRIRKLARKKGKSVSIGSDEYIKAVAFMEDFVDNLAKAKANKFIKAFKAKGGKLSISQEKPFVVAVQKYMKKTLNNNSAFRKLKQTARLNKPYQIKYRKLGKIASAKRIYNRIKVSVNKIPIVKKMKVIIKRVKTKVKKSAAVRDLKGAKKGFKKLRKLAKGAKEAEIRKFKSYVEWSKELKMARRARKIGRKKGRTIKGGSSSYTEAIITIESFADNLARIRAKKIINAFKNKGGKLGTGQEKVFIESLQRYTRKTLNNIREFKNLKSASRLNKPYQIKYRKLGKIASAKRSLGMVSKKIRVRVNKLLMSNPKIKKMISGLKKAKRKVGKYKRKVSPKRIKKGLELRKIRKKRLAEFKQTNKYKMLKSMKRRKVSLDQIKRSQNINSARKLVDDVFDEAARRQKIPISNLKYRQLKNVIKKRVSRAIRNGNLPEVNNFRSTIRKVIKDMNKPSKAPSVRVVRKGTRSYKTIKDFRPEAPKGKYVEVGKGQQLLIQEVKQIKKVKTPQELVKPQAQLVKPQVYTIQSVRKKVFDFKPFLDFGIFSLSAQGIKKSKKPETVFAIKPGQRKDFGFGRESKQDFRVIQEIAQSMGVVVSGLGAVRKSMVRQKKRPLLKLKTKTKQREKKKKIRGGRRPKRTRILSKKVMTYAFIVRKGGKAVRLRIPPMTLKDIWDVGSYRLDHDLQRTGKVMPIGETKEVAIIPKSIRGYYGRNKRKFRRFRIKKGRRYTLERTIVENKKYVGDLKSEQLALKKAAAKRKRTIKKKSKVTKSKKLIKRRVVKKRPIKRTSIKTKSQKKTIKKKKPAKRKTPTRKAKKKAIKRKVKKKTTQKVKKRRKKKSPTFPTF